MIFKLADGKSTEAAALAAQGRDAAFSVMPFSSADREGSSEERTQQLGKEYRSAHFRYPKDLQQSDKAEFCSLNRAPGSAVLYFLPRQEKANDCPDQDNRGQSDKQPFKGKKSYPKNSCFRLTVIPIQVRTVECDQNRRNYYYEHTQ